MQFDWPTPDQMIYRLTRLRRLLAIALAIPVCVMLLGSFLYPSVLPADRATLAAMAAALLVSGHVVLFPNATLETICLSIGITALVLVSPWVKGLAQLAPAEHVAAALIILMALSVLLVGALTALLQLALRALVYAGPSVRLRIEAVMDLPCSADVARRQFALVPRSRRGRILTGEADDNGFFDVAILVPQVVDPQQPSRPMVAHVTAKIMDATEQSHQVMLVLGDGSITVTSERFIPTPTGCRVEISELPGDFTLGMHAMFWLADQQMDNLYETADVITGDPARANGLAHGVSLLAVAAAVLSPQPPAPNRAE